MGFRESADARILYDKTIARNVALSTGTIFPLSDIKKALPNYDKLFKRYPEMLFFTLPLPYGNRENPEKAYYVTRNNTVVEDKLLADEEIMWAAAKKDYNFNGKKQSPHRLFWYILGFASVYKDDDTSSPLNQKIRDLEINLEQLSKIANRLPKKWTKVNMRIGNFIRRRIGVGQSAVVPTQTSIGDYTPSRLEREAAGW